MLKMTLASVAIASVFAMDQAAQPTAEETVQAFRKALKAGNREAAVTSLAPDVVIFEAGRGEIALHGQFRKRLPADAGLDPPRRREQARSRTHGTDDHAG